MGGGLHILKSSCSGGGDERRRGMGKRDGGHQRSRYRKKFRLLVVNEKEEYKGRPNRRIEEKSPKSLG